MKRLLSALLVASALWFVMFASPTAPHLNFWWAMSASACVLLSLAWGGRRDAAVGPELFPRSLRQAFASLVLGVAIAVVLWGVFWVGDKLSSFMFDFARPQVDLIYGMKSDTPPFVIALLLLLLIGPAEELFWRAYVQSTLSRHWGTDLGFLATTAVYTLVHLPSLNFMLMMAALACGLCWGLLYRLWPQHLAAIVVSHALWDAAAFVWFPF